MATTSTHLYQAGGNFRNVTAQQGSNVLQGNFSGPINISMFCQHLVLLTVVLLLMICLRAFHPEDSTPNPTPYSPTLEDFLEKTGLASKMLDGEESLLQVPQLRKALESRIQRTGRNDSMAISMMVTLAIKLAEGGKYDDSLSLLEEVLERRTSILGQGHRDTRAAKLQVAGLWHAKRSLEKAVAMERQVLESRVQTLGEDSEDTIAAKSCLAISLASCGKLKEAEGLQQDVLDWRKRSLGNGDPKVIDAMADLANTLADQGKLEEALAIQMEVYLKLLAIHKGDESKPKVAIALHNLAGCFWRLDQLDQASFFETKALPVLKTAFGENHQHSLDAMSGMASILL